MKELKGTKTEKNLEEAFAGESCARNKYTFFVSQARKEGYQQIANFFEETAKNELTHAKLFFKILHDGIPKTEVNLLEASSGESMEWTYMYKEFAETARAEGFSEIAFLFEQVGEIERRHEERYLELLENLKNNEMFRKVEETAWECLKCGHVHIGKKAPEVCPVCGHPQGYFKVAKKEY